MSRIAALSLLVLVGCGSADQVQRLAVAMDDSGAPDAATPDAPTLEPDAGDAPDGAPAEVDASAPVLDAAPAVDAYTPAVDAGAPVADASKPVDASTSGVGRVSCLETTMDWHSPPPNGAPRAVVACSKLNSFVWSPEVGTQWPAHWYLCGEGEPKVGDPCEGSTGVPAFGIVVSP